MKHLNAVYYRLKPIIPRRLQVSLRQAAIQKKIADVKNIWPIHEESKNTPEGWIGWPDGKQFALVLTHDVDTIKGAKRYRMLAEIEEKKGFRSSFNFVPERYPLPPEIPAFLVDKNFEVGVHGLHHDGKLYASKKEFLKRALKINGYLRQWGSVGFRSPAMHHNLEWIHHLNIEYDTSTFDTDPFEPQSDGMGTIFPFWVGSKETGKGYVELPYTLPQDFTLFVLLHQKDTRIWEEKLEWIAENGGMALINTHPDYMNFDGSPINYDEYPADLYARFLDFVGSKFGDAYWHALPKEVARYYKKSLDPASQPNKK